MKSYLAPIFVGAALIAMTGAVAAHHSFAMFDQEHPMQVTGVVKDFKYTSPHSFIVLEIKDKDGSSEAWNLEGGSPSALAASRRGLGTNSSMSSVVRSTTGMTITASASAPAIAENDERCAYHVVMPKP